MEFSKLKPFLTFTFFILVCSILISAFFPRNYKCLVWKLIFIFYEIFEIDLWVIHTEHVILVICHFSEYFVE